MMWDLVGIIVIICDSGLIIIFCLYFCIYFDYKCGD